MKLANFRITEYSDTLVEVAQSGNKTDIPPNCSRAGV